MDINRANLESLFSSFDVTFTATHQRALDSSIASTLAMEMPSTTSTTVHAWLKQLPFMREWVGDRMIENIASESLSIKNKKYEASLEVEADDIRDDQTGIYTPLVEILGNNAAMLWEQLLHTTLVTNDNWADDAAFFGTSRTYDGTNTISNYSTSALDETEFDSAVEKIQSYVGASGKGLKCRPFALVVGPSNRKVGFNLLKNAFTFLATGGTTTGTEFTPADNYNKGVMDLIVWDELVGTYDDYWFILSTCSGIKGLVYQVRMMPTPQSVVDMNDSHVFTTDTFMYGVLGRGRGFKALPHCIYGGYVT